jgi:hypothetical protein
MELLKTMFLGNILMMAPWTVVFLLLRWTGVRLFNLRNREDCRRIQKRISANCTQVMDGNLGGGYAVGWGYMAYMNIHVHEYGDSYNIWIITTDKIFSDLTKPLNYSDVLSDESPEKVDENEFEEEVKQAVIYERLGSYTSSFFRKRYITMTRLIPRENQKPILDKITTQYKKHGHTVVYLHGPPGTGKSVMGLLLVKELGGIYCNTLKPWQPGDTIGELYSEVEPTEDKPLIIVFDEFDTALSRFPIPEHHKIPISVPDKVGWNRMMDEIHWGLYPHVVLLLTSNRTPQFIENLDPSYIRKGRIDIIEEML